MAKLGVTAESDEIMAYFGVGIALEVRLTTSGSVWYCQTQTRRTVSSKLKYYERFYAMVLETQQDASHEFGSRTKVYGNLRKPEGYLISSPLFAA